MSVSGAISQNRYDRTSFGPGVVGWVYEYVNTAPVRKHGAMATGLEIGVQLAGDWLHDGARTGKRLYGPGSVHVISPAERYALECRARPGESGLQVGFIAYPGELADLGAEELAFGPGVENDRFFLDFCRAYRHANDTGAPLSSAEVQRELLAFLRPRLTIVPSDALIAARQEIERTFARPLYVDQLAEAAGLPTHRFTRRFAARFGTTPIAYRLQLRLNEAARLTWTRPGLSLRAIAEQVGFEDMPYFHRAFARHFGMTPAAYGRRRVSASTRPAPRDAACAGSSG